MSSLFLSLSLLCGVTSRASGWSWDLTPRSLCQVSCLSHIAANYLIAGQEAKRWGTAHQSIVPYQVSVTHLWVELTAVQHPPTVLSQ